MIIRKRALRQRNVKYRISPYRHPKTFAYMTLLYLKSDRCKSPFPCCDRPRSFLSSLSVFKAPFLTTTVLHSHHFSVLQLICHSIFSPHSCTTYRTTIVILRFIILLDCIIVSKDNCIDTLYFPAMITFYLIIPHYTTIHVHSADDW
jgi:hypothetical protein